MALEVHGVSTRAKLVLIGLANCANDDTFTCYPGRKHLAMIGDCSVDTVDRAVKELDAAHLIDVQPQWADGGDRIPTVNLYRVFPAFDPSRKSAASPVTPRRIIAERANAEMRPPSPQAAAATVAAKDAATKEPSLEPSLDTPSLRSGVRNKRRAAIDPSLSLPDSARMFALERGFLNGEPDSMWERFKNHHAAKGTLFASVEAGWRTWVLNEIKFLGERHVGFTGGSARPRGVVEAILSDVGRRPD